MDDYLGQFKARKRQTQDIASISPTGLISLAREQRLVLRILLRTAAAGGMHHGDLLAKSELTEAEMTAALNTLIAQGWVELEGEGKALGAERRYRAVLRIVAKQSARSTYWDAIMGDAEESAPRTMISSEIDASLRRFLPAVLYAQLSNVDAMAEAVQHLNRLHRAVTAYLPLYVAEGDILTTDRYVALREGTFIFADVSGFTAMSEWLARRGGGGAENLTAVMNAYFETMLDILSKSDAQVLKFAGDALLAFFPARNAQDLADAHRAIRAGLRMQRAMLKTFQPIHDDRILDVIGRETEHRLSMTVGVARGALFEALVGNHSQCELMIQGELPGLAMSAEAVGIGNEVIIDAQLAARVTDDYTLQATTDPAFLQVMDTFGDALDDYEMQLVTRRRAKSGALFDREAASLNEHLRVTLEKLLPAATYLAPAVLDQLILSGDYRVPADNRYAVSMFIHATGFAEMLGNWGPEHLGEVYHLLERYFTTIQPLIAARGGSLIRSDPYELGVKILVIFGAPVAHMDDPLRAVDAAVAIHRQLELLLVRVQDELPEELRRGLDIRNRIGISRGEVFAGEVGWRARREYTVMGDAVNLAARLMSKSEFGTTWIDERMRTAVEERYALDEMQPLKLKGKTGFIQSYAVAGPRSSELSPGADNETMFIGRSLLLLSVSRGLEEVLANQARRAYLLVGEVGTGKTRVVRKLALNAQAMGYTVAMARPQPGASRSLLWASLISSLLGLPTEMTSDAVIPMITDSMSALGLHADTPLMLRLLVEEGGMYDYDRTSTASGALPRRELAPVIVNFLRAYCAARPTLLVIDDVDQAGSDTQAIIRDIMFDSADIALVLIGTSDINTPVDISAIPLDITDLNEEETEESASALLGGVELGTRLRSLIWQQTGGRPAFIEAQLNALRVADALETYGCVVELRPNTPALQIPNEVRDLAASRADRLAPEQQAVLRAASVLVEPRTPRIPLAALLAVAEIDNQRTLLSNVQALELAGLLLWDNIELCWFRHGLVQQAVYASLLRPARLKLHRRAVEYWRAAPDSPARPLHLAHHLARTGLLPQAVDTLTSAAEAIAAEQPAQAIIFYRAALDLLPDQAHIQTAIEALETPAMPE